ncbi:MAG: signal peptide peptidase SppA, partial [Myxococcota bacterium]
SFDDCKARRADGLGTTFAWASSRNPVFDGLFTVTSAATFRPHRVASLAVVARDWNNPVSEFVSQNPEFDVPLNRTGRSIDMGVTLRPANGDRGIELGLEASHRFVDDAWVPGANFAVDIPFVGRLRAGAQLIDPEAGDVLVSTGLDINVGRLQMFGGGLYGNALGASNSGFIVGAAIRGFDPATRLPLPHRVVKFRVESAPSVRGHTAMLRRLWRLADDREVDGVLFEYRARPTPSLPHAEEMIDAIRLLRQRGKKVMCHLEDASGQALYVCSAADRIAINPAGGLRFAGLASRYLYLGGLLDKLGIRADFVRIGRHKGAAEQFTEGATDVARADHRELLRQFERVFLQQVAAGRAMPYPEAKLAISAGPFIAAEARARRLVDTLVYEDEIPRFVEEVMGGQARIVPYRAPNPVPPRWVDGSKVAVIYLEGTMVDGKSQDIPFVGIKLAGSYTIAKALRQARTDPSIDAVVFRIETGGGSSLASDVILREATLLAKQKPLIVSMGSAAASGGYYASVAGKEVFANRSTVTGSIGIFYGKFDIAQLLTRIGITTDAVRTAPRADAESIYRPFSDDERRELGRKVKQFYDLFIGRVAEGRGMTPEAVDAVARGKVWTGQQAKRRKLVDRIGGLRQALARARELGDVPQDAPIVELPPRGGLLATLLKLTGLTAKPSIDVSALRLLSPSVRLVARALVPFLVFEPTQPLALADVASIR